MRQENGDYGGQASLKFFGELRSLRNTRTNLCFSTEGKWFKTEHLRLTLLEEIVYSAISPLESESNTELMVLGKSCFFSVLLKSCIP